MLGLTECSSSKQVLSMCVYACTCLCVSMCVLLTWNQSCGGVIMISALLPVVSSLTAPDGDCKPLLCLQRQSSLISQKQADTNTRQGGGKALFHS